jgi:hypothetical protein
LATPFEPRGGFDWPRSGEAEATPWPQGVAKQPPRAQKKIDFFWGLALGGGRNPMATWGGSSTPNRSLGVAKATPRLKWGGWPPQVCPFLF